MPFWKLPGFGKLAGIRSDLLPFFDEQKMDGTEMTYLHLFFESLDRRRDFDAMLALLTEEDEGYCKKGELLVCHVRASKIMGWNALDSSTGIKFLIDALPIAGASTVIIDGLRERTELNRKSGKVLGCVKTGRFAVSIDSHGFVLVKPSNLLRVD